MALLPTVGLLNGPVYAPLLFGLALLRATRGIAVDRPLAGLAACFALLCLASSLWSIVPAHSTLGALQVTLVLSGALLLIAGPPLPPQTWTVLAVALLAGTLAMLADRATGSHLLHRVTHGGVPKYNRGIDYLTLLACPLALALARTGRRRLLAAVLLATLACVAAGRNTTAWIAVPIVAGVFLLARHAPRLVQRTLGVGTAAGALLLPFALRLLSNARPALAPHLKESMLRRLEIWDYVSARIVERPLAGWGFWSAKSLPITSAELSHYVREHGQGIYPHNQWLELWVETGLFGVVLAIGLVLLLLWRIRHLPASTQPCAYAAVSLALLISQTSFEISTDSWWAALAGCALLFASVPAPGQALSPPAPAGRLGR